MIDGVKIAVPLGAQEWLRRSTMISWVQNGVFSSGLQRYRGTWNGWHFKGDPDRCFEVRGSFHKYAHGGSNWRDIRLEEVTGAVHRFCDILLLHPAQLVLRNVEVGVNVSPPIPPKELFPCLVHHRLQAPTREVHGLRFIHDGYWIKVYDKAEQEGLPPSLSHQLPAKPLPPPQMALQLLLKFERARSSVRLAQRAAKSRLRRRGPARFRYAGLPPQEVRGHPHR